MDALRWSKIDELFSLLDATGWFFFPLLLFLLHRIFCDVVPNASFNFLALAASNYYDNTTFHRNIKGFMVQGGDPSGSGKGGESIWGKPFIDEFHADLKHGNSLYCFCCLSTTRFYSFSFQWIDAIHPDKRGVVSFANKGPDSNGSQFFICYGAQPHLNNQNTIFGQVIDGFDVLDALERTPVGKKNRPVTDIVIERIIIHANPLAT